MKKIINILLLPIIFLTTLSVLISCTSPSDEESIITADRVGDALRGRSMNLMLNTGDSRVRHDWTTAGVRTIRELTRAGNSTTLYHRVETLELPPVVTQYFRYSDFETEFSGEWMRVALAGEWENWMPSMDLLSSLEWELLHGSTVGVLPVINLLLSALTTNFAIFNIDLRKLGGITYGADLRMVDVLGVVTTISLVINDESDNVSLSLVSIRQQLEQDFDLIICFLDEGINPPYDAPTPMQQN